VEVQCVGRCGVLGDAVCWEMWCVERSGVLGGVTDISSQGLWTLRFTRTVCVGGGEG